MRPLIFARNADPSGYGLKGMLPAPLYQVSFEVVCQRKVGNAGSTYHRLGLAGTSPQLLRCRLCWRCCCFAIYQGNIC